MADSVATIVKRMNDEIAKIKGGGLAGMLAGGFIVLREAQENVPVEFGLLKASGFCRRAIDDPNAVEVGFSQKYALAVHENFAMKWRGKPRKPKKGRKTGIGVYWGPKGKAGYLSHAIRDKESAFLAQVRARAEVR